MEIKQKKGISLIVLVITIIVMIILATAIILSLNSSGIIGKANKAKEDTDISTIREVASIASAEYELEKVDGTTTKTKKEYVEEYLNNQNLELPEGYTVNEEGQVLNSSEIVVISEWDGTVATSFASGTGTEADPYIIETAQQFAYLADFSENNSTSNVYFKLECDIDFKSIEFGGISGNSGFFNGIFDGNNHKVYNLKLDRNNEYDGLFFARNATIKNLSVESGEIVNPGYGTGVIAYASGNCTIENCINKISVTGSRYVCGIAYCENGNNTIANCVNYGTMIAPSSYQISNVTYSNCQELGSTSTN